MEAGGFHGGFPHGVSTGVFHGGGGGGGSTGVCTGEGAGVSRGCPLGFRSAAVVQGPDIDQTSN